MPLRRYAPPLYAGRDTTALDPRLQQILASPRAGNSPSPNGAELVVQYPQQFGAAPLVVTPNRSVGSIQATSSGQIRLQMDSTFGYAVADVWTLMAGISLASTSEHGRLVKIGDGSTGFALCVGSTDGDTNGNNLLALKETLAWSTTNPAIGTGFHVCSVILGGSVNSHHLFYQLDGTQSAFAVEGAAPILAANASTIGGYGGTGLATNGVRIHFVIALKGTPDADLASRLFPPGTPPRLISARARLRTVYSFVSGANAVLAEGGATAVDTTSAFVSVAFAYYKSLTLDHTQAGSADSTDWPLAICLDGNVQGADADLKTVANGGFVQSASGYDIRPYADAALTTPLAFELVYYQASTGTLEMHVKIPTLSASVDTVIYLAFGDASITTNGSSNATWDSAYKLVLHLGDGSTVSGTDSTSNANNGTVTGTTAVAGQLKGGASFNGTSDHITAGVTGVPSGGNTVTVSCWQKQTSNSAQMATVDISTASGKSFTLTPLLITGVYYAWTDSVTQNLIVTAGQSVPLNAWHLVTVNFDGTNVNYYLDGVFQAQTTYAVNTGAPSAVDIGRRVSGVTAYYPGSLDEIRISAAARSASWILADYNAQKTSSTFVAWSAKIPATGTTYSDSVAEGTATAADSVAAGLSVSSSVTEGSASAADATSCALVQSSFPVSDIAADGWLGHDPFFGGSPPLWDMLDEAEVDFTDYIYSPPNPTIEQFEVALAALSDPASSTDHGVDIAMRAVNADAHFDFDLVQGSTILDSWTEAVTVAQGNVIRTHTLSGAVADSITDYTNLRIRGVARA